MPSSVTHSYFVNDIYEKLDFKERLNLNYFKIFGQGPDPFSFYNLHLGSKSKRISEIGKAMQHTKVNKHFISLINYINKKNYYDNPLVISYLYGQICHFVLDSTAHPYIIYYAGRYDENDKKKYKYNGKHEEMEYYIDIYFIQERENIAPKKYKVYKEIFKFDKFNDELSDTIDYVIKDVYGFYNVSNIYYKCLRNMKKFYHIFNYDRFGIKKAIYSLMDMVCPESMVKKKELSFHVAPNSHIEYLNLNKEIWKDPCDGKEYNSSFLDLYNIAIEKGIKIINEVDNMLSTGTVDNKKLEKLFNNLDYGTGKNCDQKIEYKYFKY